MKKLSLYQTIHISGIRSDVMSYIRFSSDMCETILPVLKVTQLHQKNNQNITCVLSIAFHILPVLQNSPISITYGVRSILDTLMQKFQNNTNLLNGNSHALFNFLSTINSIFEKTDEVAIKNNIIDFYQRIQNQLLNWKACCSSHEELVLCIYLVFVRMFQIQELLNWKNEEGLNKMASLHSTNCP
jgi:hypothetical protein